MKAIIWIIIIALVVLGVIFIMNNNSQNSPADVNNQNESMEGGDEAMMEEHGENMDDEVMEGDEAMMEKEGDEAMMEDHQGEGDQMTEEGNNQSEEVVITYNGLSFSPAEVTVAPGTVVTFRNESNREVWPASAVHPTHTVYPGSDIQKCGTNEQSSIFDACRGLQFNETFSFQFNEIGEWGYHNHLNASQFGKIIVK